MVCLAHQDRWFHWCGVPPRREEEVVLAFVPHHAPSPPPPHCQFWFAFDSYKDSFNVNANKFPWEHAEQLRWQDGLVYAPLATLTAPSVATAPVVDAKEPHASGDRDS